jgi:hypothetical protein
MPMTSNGRGAPSPAPAQPARRAFAVEQAHAARLHGVGFAVVALALRGRRQLDAQLAFHLCAGQLVLVVALHAREPLDDGGVVGNPQVTHRARRQCHGLRLQVGLDAAHRHRQRRLGVQLQHAERRGGKLHQRRRGPGLRLEREGRGVGQRPPGIVAQVTGQLDAKPGVLGQRRIELHGADRVVRHLVAGAPEDQQELAQHTLALRDELLLAFAAPALQHRAARAVGRGQHDALGEAARHRRRELHPQRPDRQAVGARADALAAEAGGERLAHAPAQAAFGAGRHAGGRADAGAPHDLDPRLAGERPRAAHGGHARLLGHQLHRREDGLAHRPAHHLQPDALADAGDLAMPVLLDAGRRGRTVEQEDEHLLLFDARVVARLRKGAHDGRPAGAEAEPGRAGDRFAGERP